MNKITKGLVLEVDQDKVIVFTPDGRFLKRKIKGKTPEIGTEIDINLVTVNWKAWSLLGVAALLVLMIIPFLSLQSLINPQVVVAYVSIDINPSIELGLNNEEKVISMKALNTEGSQLLNKLKIKTLPIEEALELITEEAIKERYINRDKENVVFISYSKEESDTYSFVNNSIRKKQLERKVKDIVERNEQQAVVEIIQVSPEIRKNAAELGLSSGKYTLMLEAWDAGIEVLPENIKKESIINAIKDAGGNPAQVITHIHQRTYDNKVSEELSIKYHDKLKELKTKIQIAENKSKDFAKEKGNKKETIIKTDKNKDKPTHKQEKLSETPKTVKEKVEKNDQEFKKEILEEIMEKADRNILEDDKIINNKKGNIKGRFENTDKLPKHVQQMLEEINKRRNSNNNKFISKSKEKLKDRDDSEKKSNNDNEKEEKYDKKQKQKQQDKGQKQNEKLQLEKELEQQILEAEEILQQKLKEQEKVGTGNAKK